MAVGGSDVHNPEALENINPLYVPVEEGWRNNTPENQESVIDLPSPKPSQGDETMKEPMHSIPLINEPIYSVVRKDKPSIKKPPTKPMENVSIDLNVKIEVLQEKSNHSSAPVNPGVPPSSSFKLNTMIMHWRTKNFKTSPSQSTVSINVDLEDPPPIPDKSFDIENEAESEEQHPNEVCQLFYVNENFRQILFFYVVFVDRVGWVGASVEFCWGGGVSVAIGEFSSHFLMGQEVMTILSIG